MREPSFVFDLRNRKTFYLFWLNATTYLKRQRTHID
jgi:hypothetical protein